jgi:hypothetical protein
VKRIVAYVAHIVDTNPDQTAEDIAAWARMLLGHAPAFSALLANWARAEGAADKMFDRVGPCINEQWADDAWFECAKYVRRAGLC